MYILELPAVDREMPSKVLKTTVQTRHHSLKLLPVSQGAPDLVKLTSIVAKTHGLTGLLSCNLTNIVAFVNGDSELRRRMRGCCSEIDTYDWSDVVIAGSFVSGRLRITPILYEDGFFVEHGDLSPRAFMSTSHL